jgi:DNA-binding NarL/FixJ family response regulator
VTLGRATVDRLKAEGARMTVPELMEAALARPDDDRNPLSRREREVAELVGSGLTNPEIAEKLFISRRTVESHVDHIKQKLGVPGRHGVIAWAMREGLVAADG